MEDRKLSSEDKFQQPKVPFSKFRQKMTMVNEERNT